MKVLFLLFLLMLTPTHSFLQSEANNNSYKDTLVIYDMKELLTEKYDSSGNITGLPWSESLEAYYTKNNDSLWVMLSYSDCPASDDCEESMGFGGLLILNKRDTSKVDIKEVIVPKMDFFLAKPCDYFGYIQVKKVSKRELCIQFNFRVKDGNREIVVNMSERISNYGSNKRNRKYSYIYKWFVLNGY